MMNKTILFSGIFGLVIGAGIFTFFLTNAQTENTSPQTQIQTCGCMGDKAQYTCGKNCSCQSCMNKISSCSGENCSQGGSCVRKCGGSCGVKSSSGCGCRKAE